MDLQPTGVNPAQEIARVCHEVNRAICQAIGDHSQPVWKDAPASQQHSVLDGVFLKLAKPDTTPAEMHKSWVDQKLTEGWLRGDAKDQDKKLHPNMVPFVDLPIEEKIKDHVFSAIVELLAPIFSTPVANQLSAQEPVTTPTLTASSVGEESTPSAPVETPTVNSVGAPQMDGAVTDAPGQVPNPVSKETSVL